MNNYQQTIMERRIAEAEIMWKQMLAEGLTETTVVAQDFVFFSNSEPEANNLINQLSENYTLEKEPSSDPEYIFIKGTTRPYGNEINYIQWLDWVKFMVSVGFSHNSVFSKWSVYSPQSKTTWSSESIEAL